MANTGKQNDGVETLLNRLSKVTDQIAKASESQAREADRQLKRFIDQGEASTQRMLKAIDTELQSQIASVRREFRDVERRLTEVRKSVTAKVTAKRSQAAKPAAKATTAKPANRPATKPAATNRTATKRAPAKKTTARKASTAKSAVAARA